MPVQTAANVCWLLVILTSLVSVRAKYNVSITVYSYNNPGSKCASCDSVFGSDIKGCCDNHDNIGTCTHDELCDPGFYFCLRPLSGGECVSNTITVSSFSRDVTTLTRVRTESPNTLGGLIDLPIEIRGISNRWMGVQLYIRVLDADTISTINGTTYLDDNDTIDQFFINITSGLGISTFRTTYHGIAGLAAMDLSFRVTCAEHYYGDNCENLNECTLNSITCSGRGRCEDGEGTYECVCEARYTGSQCEDLNDCHLNSVTCSGNGRCVDGFNSYSCDCDSGYTGELCEQKQAAIGAIVGGLVGGLIALVVILSIVICGGVLLYKSWNKIPTPRTNNRQCNRPTATRVSGPTMNGAAIGPPPQHPPPAYPGVPMNFSGYPQQNYPQNFYGLPEQQGYHNPVHDNYPQYNQMEASTEVYQYAGY